MNSQQTLSLALQVEKMRKAQKSYFDQIATAKRTKIPEDFALANKTLKESKVLEEAVDTAVQDVINRQ